MSLHSVNTVKVLNVCTVLEVYLTILYYLYNSMCDAAACQVPNASGTNLNKLVNEINEY